MTTNPVAPDHYLSDMTTRPDIASRLLRRRDSYPSDSSFTSTAEAKVFIDTWCRVIDRMTRNQQADRGKQLLSVWYDSIDGADHELDDKVDFENLAARNYPPLFDSLVCKHRPKRAPSAAPLDRRIDWLANTLGLDAIEREILALLARCSVHDEWNNLLRALPGRGHNPSAGRLGFLAGIPASKIEVRLAPGSRLWATGLVDNDGDGEFSANNLLQFVARVRSAPSRLPQLLMPTAKKSSLTWDDFDHIGPQREIAEKMIASGKGAAILLYGPPGTGKTEFAKLLAERNRGKAVFAGLGDKNGREPTRRERLGHLSILRALTRGDPSRIVVMDEADDILMLGGDDRREGRSKLWLNRLIESGERPTIWILNEPRLLDRSIVRRMSLAIEFPAPPLHVRRRIVEQHAKKAKLALTGGEAARLAALPAAPAVLASAVQGARLAGGGACEALAIGEGLVTALRGRPPEPFALPNAYDPSLALADADLDALAGRLEAAPGRGWSLLLAGPSGTGKSAYARHLAERLGIELIEKRGSDLLGMYVGETEGRIAHAFAEAKRGGAMLLIDEADDFLSDRRDVVRGWERSMVNEMLRQMESLAAPFVATTNLANRLDPATRRRFTLHAEFGALDWKRAAMLFPRWFDLPLPRGITLHGQTPGDFAVVDKRRKLLDEHDPMVIVKWLRAEAEARGEGRTAMGFAA